MTILKVRLKLSRKSQALKLIIFLKILNQKAQVLQNRLASKTSLKLWECFLHLKNKRLLMCLYKKSTYQNSKELIQQNISYNYAKK